MDEEKVEVENKQHPDTYKAAFIAAVFLFCMLFIALTVSWEKEVNKLKDEVKSLTENYQVLSNNYAETQQKLDEVEKVSKSIISSLQEEVAEAEDVATSLMLEKESLEVEVLSLEGEVSELLSREPTLDIIQEGSSATMTCSF